jgi:hypothetical protein
VPSYRWARRAVTVGGWPAASQAQSRATGQAVQRGPAAVQTSAPSSITATDQRAATAGSAGNSDSASRRSAADGAAADGCWPVISLPNTRRTLVSSTACRWPKAKLATAAAVYRPIPGSASRASRSVGTHPPCRSVKITAVSCNRSARRG